MGGAKPLSNEEREKIIAFEERVLPNVASTKQE